MGVDADCAFFVVTILNHVIFREPLCPVIIVISAFEHEPYIWHKVFIVTGNSRTLLSVCKESSWEFHHVFNVPIIISLWHIDTLNSTIEFSICRCETPLFLCIFAKLDSGKLRFPIHGVTLHCKIYRCWTHLLWSSFESTEVNMRVTTSFVREMETELFVGE